VLLPLLLTAVLPVLDAEGTPGHACPQSRLPLAQRSLLTVRANLPQDEPDADRSWPTSAPASTPGGAGDRARRATGAEARSSRSADDQSRSPPGAHPQLDGKTLIPGLVDTHSHVAIFAAGVQANADGNEMTNPVQPGLRALDAINPDDPASAWRSRAA